jgi:hypothetical protein
LLDFWLHPVSMLPTTVTANRVFIIFLGSIILSLFHQLDLTEAPGLVVGYF